jgi:hypothetical protein
MKKSKHFKEPEIIETNFKVVYNEGCASITQDLHSFYADNIISDAELIYEDCKWHIMKFPKKKSNIKVKKFKNIKQNIEE